MPAKITFPLQFNIRSTAFTKDLLKTLNIEANVVSDWCCGTGMSTDALYDSFKDAEIYGVDTSNEMLKVARKRSVSDAEFLLGNVEDIILPKKADLITIMFALHEIPQYARINVLKNVKKIFVPERKLIKFKMSKKWQKEINEKK